MNSTHTPSLIESIGTRDRLIAELAEIERDWNTTRMEKTRAITEARELIGLHCMMIDPGKVKLAETVIYATDPAKGGDDWRTCVRDALHEIVHGKKACYQSLNDGDLCTKDYDRWTGQRSDHAHGYGPKHGSICFRIGLTRALCERGGIPAMDAEEKEAAAYYLLNLETIWKAKRDAAIARAEGTR